MSQPEMDYWREFPKDMLLDRRLQKLSPEEFTAWFWLRTRARAKVEGLPPGILPPDDDFLADVSNMKPAVWGRVKAKVLGMFVRDEGGRYHDPQTREEYSTYCRLVFERRCEGHRNTVARWKKQNVVTKAQEPKWEDPYANYPLPPNSPLYGPMPPNRDSEAGIAAVRGLSEPIGQVSNRQIDGGTDRHLPAAPPPAGGVAAAVEPLGQELARLSREAIAQKNSQSDVRKNSQA